MSIKDIFKRKETQDTTAFDDRHNEAKLVLGELYALGGDIDGIIVIYSIDRMPHCLAGGIDSIYEGLGLLDFAKYEINKKGVPIAND